MAIKLTDKPNTEAPGSDYTFGSIRDRIGSTPGTPVSREVYSDFHQFFEKLMSEAQIIHNGLPDNDYSGFQLFDAFRRLSNARANENIYGISQTGTNDPVITGLNSESLLPFSGFSANRTGAGEYELTVTGGFSGFASLPNALQLVASSGSPRTSATETIECYFQDNKIIIKTYDSMVLTDGILDNYCFSIRLFVP